MRLYTLPDEPIPSAVAAAKPLAAELAGRLGDALVIVDPDPAIVERHREAGDAPRCGQVKLFWAEIEQEAKQTVFDLWRHSGVEGTINQAGFDQISLHQVGADQDGFFRFWKQELLPKLG